MSRASIVDPRWVGDLVGGSVFLLAAATAIYVWATSMHPLPRLSSAIVYYTVLVILVLLLILICYAGFTYRWTEVYHDQLIVHEGYYALFWRTRVIPKSQIAAMEQYDRSRQGAFTHIRASGIRIRLVDGTQIVLAESDGEGHYKHEWDELRETLNLPASNN